MILSELGAVTLGTIIEGTFYGAYVVLFILYLVLLRRNNRAVDGPLTLAQILLFGLCTLAFCLDIPGAYFFVVPDVANDNTFNKIETGSLVVFALTDYLAQMTLLYRCWIIWDRRWVAVAIPGFLALVTLGGGFVLLGLYNSTNQENLKPYELIGTTTYSISLAVNALTTSLIVTKILLISQKAYPGLAYDSQRSFRIVTAMLIESGLLMFTFQLIFVVLFFAQKPALEIIAGSITQIYGITPTLLSIRVVMGSAYDKSTEKTRSLRFTHSGGATTRITGTSVSVAGIQTRVTDIELDDASDNERAAGGSA